MTTPPPTDPNPPTAIPEAAVEAAAKASFNMDTGEDHGLYWGTASEMDKAYQRDLMREALTAALPHLLPPTTPGPVPVTEGVVGRLREGWLRLYKDRHYWDGSPEHLAQIETDMGLLSGDMTAPLPPPVEPGPGLVVDADVIRRFAHVTSICHAQAQTINHLEAQLTFIRSQGTAMPPPPSAPGLDEFAAWLDRDFAPTPRYHIVTVDDEGQVMGSIDMAEVVAQFRASRSVSDPVDPRTAEERSNGIRDDIERLGWTVWDLHTINNLDGDYKAEARHPDGSIRRVPHAPNKMAAVTELLKLVQEVEHSRPAVWWHPATGAVKVERPPAPSTRLASKPWQPVDNPGIR